MNTFTVTTMKAICDEHMVSYAWDRYRFMVFFFDNWIEVADIKQLKEKLIYANDSA